MWLHNRLMPLMRSIVLGCFANVASAESPDPASGATRRFQKQVRRVAVIGGGPIALSWAAYYFIRGFEVVAADPARKSTGNCRQDIDRLLGTALDPNQPLAARGSLKITSDLDEALLRADFIQECATGTASSKVDLLTEIDKCTRPDSIISSDADANSMSVAQSILHFGDRCVVAQPFDLPHLSPFTVILNSIGTSPLAIRQAINFYSRIGRVPIYLRGQVNEDFTSDLLALFRLEAVRLRELDVVSERDLNDFGSWAPTLCCSALVSAVQADNMLGKALLHNSGGSAVTAAFGRSDKRSSSRESPVATNVSASSACVP